MLGRWLDHLVIVRHARRFTTGMTSHLILSPLLLLAAGGCYFDGNSRSQAVRDPTALLYSLYDGSAASAKPSKLALPASIAVVQVGEVAPPTSMLDALRADPAVFGRVESIPATEAMRTCFTNGSNGGPTPDLSRDLTKMRRLAADLGMTHLLLFGGTVETNTYESPLGLLDATIVGGFVVPSKRVKAQSKVSATLIDVAAGRPAVAASAEGSADAFVPSNEASGKRRELSDKAADLATKDLTAQLLARCRDYAANPPATVGPVVAGEPEPAAPVEAAPPTRAAPQPTFWNRFGNR